MTDRPSDPGTGGRESTTGAPRWVKVFGIIGLLVVLLLVIALLMGKHGPGRHTLPGDTGGHTLPSGVPEHE